MIKESIHQEDNAKINRAKREINSNTIIPGNFNISLSTTDHPENKRTVDLNDTIKKINICRTFYHTTVEHPFLSDMKHFLV